MSSNKRLRFDIFKRREELVCKLAQLMRLAKSYLHRVSSRTGIWAPFIQGIVVLHHLQLWPRTTTRPLQKPSSWRVRFDENRGLGDLLEPGCCPLPRSINCRKPRPRRTHILAPGSLRSDQFRTRDFTSLRHSFEHRKLFTANTLHHAICTGRRGSNWAVLKRLPEFHQHANSAS